MKKNNSTCCLIFSKNPVPGKTKTRLIPTLGVEGAFQVHLSLLKYTLSITEKINNIDFQLHHTSPEDKSALLYTLEQKKNISTHLQHGKDLGERMHHAMSMCLQKYKHCIIIGTDCPELSEQYIVAASNYLKSGYDAVIGPAYDGGYVLIGLNQVQSQIFTDIHWGEDSVLASTLNAFRLLNLKYKELATLHDIDRKEDLQYLKLISDF